MSNTLRNSLIAGAVVLVVGIAVAFWTGALHVGLQAAICETDDEIPSDTHADVQTAAMHFAYDFFASDQKSVYGQMTSDFRAHNSQEALGTVLTHLVAVAKPQSEPRFAHLYYLRAGGAGAPGRVLCGTTNTVSMTVLPNLNQAYAVITTEGRNYGWVLVLWLVPEDGGWHVRDARLTTGSAAGRDAETLLAQARAERDSGHSLNAALLYGALVSLVDRGPNFQPAEMQEVRDDLSRFRAPPELTGKPPFSWNLGGKTYLVATAKIAAIGKDLGVVFDLPQTDWPGNDAIDARNKEFLDAFRAAHPDYARDFEFLVARGIKPDNSGGFATPYDNKKGYVPKIANDQN
ncbi:MAG TPA: hypothetical protein VGG48_02155 [Rhizomicrobium sp.]